MNSSSMSADLLLSGRLLLFLSGLFLYGFLLREKVRRPGALRDNSSVGDLLLLLTIWYGGCLLDDLFRLFSLEVWGWLDRSLDFVRALALVLAQPMLAQAIWSLIPARTGGAAKGGRPGAWVLFPSYGTIALLLPALLLYLTRGGTSLTSLAVALYPRFVVHAGVGCATAILLCLVAGRSLGSRPYGRFFRWLAAALSFTTVLLVSALFPLRWAGGTDWAQVAWTFAAGVSWFAPGLTFLWFVQRQNLLRLALTYRNLRHTLLFFVWVLLLVSARFLMGPDHSEVYRRLLGLGIVFGLAIVGLVPLWDRWVPRSTILSRVSGRSLDPRAVATISQQFRRLEIPEEELRDQATEFLSLALGASLSWLSPDSDPSLYPELESLLQLQRKDGFSRLDPPTDRAEAILNELGAYAALPLRVDGGLDRILLLKYGRAGGGWEPQVLETLKTLLRQLGTSIEVRRLLSERIRTEEQLSESQRLSMLGMVSASLAHEVRNPLTSMKALAQTLLEEFQRERPDSDAAADLGAIVDQTNRLQEVTREILGFAKPREGETTDLSTLTRSVVYMLHQEATRKIVALEGDEIEEVGAVRGTAAAWQTITFNLIRNAIQHAPANSTVRVRLCREGDTVRFETENSGPSLPPELAATMFEPFTTTTGTGLGLALVQRRADELGGRIVLIDNPGTILFRIEMNSPTTAVSP